jgi:hypothetical protein
MKKDHEGIANVRLGEQTCLLGVGVEAGWVVGKMASGSQSWDKVDSFINAYGRCDFERTA